MGLQSETKVIGDYSYTVTQLDAVRGRRVALRLAKVLAPAATRVAGVFDTAKSATKPAKPKRPAADDDGAESADEGEDNPTANFSLEQFASAIEAALVNTSEADFDFFCDTLSAATSVEYTDDDGKVRNPKLSVVFGVHFAGRYKDLLAWLKFAVEVNFGNFSELFAKHRAS